MKIKRRFILLRKETGLLKVPFINAILIKLNLYKNQLAYNNFKGRLFVFSFYYIFTCFYNYKIINEAPRT